MKLAPHAGDLNCYASIMLEAFHAKLCQNYAAWHNRQKPTQ